MNNTIKYFMWGYQQHFQVLAQDTAERILGVLNPKFQPNLFLVGVLVEEKENSHPVCIEPEDCGYDISLFSDIKKQAEHIKAIDPERHGMHSHPIAQENHNKRIELRALINAIIQALEITKIFDGKKTYCSWPVLIEGYFVCVVLELNNSDIEGIYSLRKDTYQSRYKVSTSLLDATIKEILSSFSSTLLKPSPGTGFIIERDDDDVFRAAGRSIMKTISWAIGDITGGSSLFKACNSISSMRYEGAEGVGKMLLGHSGHQNIELNLRLLNPVKIHDYRAIRKLLEITSENNLLLCDSEFVYGFGKQVGIYNHTKENLFVINFLEHYSWELLHAEHILMEVNYREPRLPRKKINESKFKNDLLRIFPGIDPKSISILWKITLEATRQKHGTMVVVSNEAELEAKRLQLQSTLIEPIKLTPEIMSTITAIDGAVLIDPKSICYAIGVILDGLATDKGSPSRGARYNSAIRYIEGKKECIAIIISEDGSIDLVPDLMPQISHRLLQSKLNDLTELANEEKDKIDFKKYNKLMSWFTNHEFYLSQEICGAINSLKPIIDEKIDPRAIRIQYRDLRPNEEMNDSYFVE